MRILKKLNGCFSDGRRSKLAPWKEGDHSISRPAERDNIRHRELDRERERERERERDRERKRNNRGEKSRKEKKMDVPRRKLEDARNVFL